MWNPAASEMVGFPFPDHNSYPVQQTFSTLLIFILAMLLYPEAQKHAQAEIDSMIGSNLARLPGWENRTSLPYIDAAI